MKRQSLDEYFFNNHLTEEAVALYADALVLSKEKMMADAILEHVESCKQCKKAILDVYLLSKNSGSTEQEMDTHPFLDQTASFETRIAKPHSRIFLKIAAVIVMVIGIGVVIYFLATPKNNHKILQNQIIAGDTSLNSK